MSSFTAPLVLSPGRERLWITAAAFQYEIGMLGSGLVVTVPAGFETDLGTIPLFARALFNPADAKCAKAFVLHDYLCKIDGFTRAVTDAVLFEALCVLEVALWRAIILYTSVSLWRCLKYIKGR
jgi:Protein of unknown function (DUF1353)